MTVFSIMSNPDVLLTIKAYTCLKMSMEVKLADHHDDVTAPELDELKKNIDRLEVLCNVLIEEWTRRGNK